MRRILPCLWLCSLILLPFLAIGGLQTGASPSVQTVDIGTVRPIPTASHVTIIILDMSGSMAQNDPDGLRCSAANAFIDLSGPGDYIGVVDLDGAAATDIAQPTQMDTVAARQQMRERIQAKTNGCSPDGNTPTYDALQHALSMLTSAAEAGNVAGSVILLTDGVPYPDPNGQLTDIRDKLVPQFQQHQWPVDVVALGQPGLQNGVDFHKSLSAISDATLGNFYDDGHGVVPGISPLNIAPYFVQIFQQRIGRTPGPYIPPSDLNSGTVRRNFQIGPLVDHLDLIVIKDHVDTQVRLLANGQVVTANNNGIFVSTDNHYLIYSINGPQAGTWEIDVSGAGMFVVESLLTSSLTVTILSPSHQTPVEPLGQPFLLKASLVYLGSIVTNGEYTVTAKLIYAGDTNGGSPYSQIVAMTDPTGSGMFSAQATVPPSAPTGTYTVQIDVTEVSSAVIASATATLRLDLFPSPELLDLEGHASDPVQSTVTVFDPALQLLYGPGQSGTVLGSVINWLSQPPLAGLPGSVTANIPGQVVLNGKPYCDAIVTGTATLQPGAGARSILVHNQSCGRFTVNFSSPQSGTYTIKFLTTGSYKDSHGDLGKTYHTASLHLQLASLDEELRAWAITALYFLVLAYIILWIKSRFTNDPNGVYSETVTSGTSNYRPLLKRRPWYLALLQRNVLVSYPSLRKSGLQIQIARNGTIRLRAHGKDSDRWYLQNGTPVPHRFTQESSASYGRPSEHATLYRFMAKKTRRPRRSERGTGRRKPPGSPTLPGFTPRSGNTSRGYNPLSDI